MSSQKQVSQISPLLKKIPVNRQEQGEPHKSALRITLTYALLGTIWIVISDKVVDWIFADQASLVFAQTVKGLFYIGITSLLVYWLARRAVNNIRERLLTHQLHSTEELLETIISSLGEAVFIVDPANRTILQCNPAAERVFGYRQEELIGSSTEILHTSRNAYEKFAALGEPYLEKGEVFRTSFQMKRKDGTVIATEQTVSIMTDDSGWTKKVVVSIVRDISERRQAKRQLEASERRFRTIFEKANDGILIAEARTGSFLYANPAVSYLLGYPLEELSKMGVRDIHPKEYLSKVLADFQAVVEGRIDFTPEIPCLCKNGKIAYVDIKGGVMDIDGKRCNVGFFRDVTEAVRLRREKRALEAQLRQSQKLEAIGTLAGGVAHEINNPIMGIKGYAELLGEEVEEDSRVNEYVKKIQQETNRIQKVIRNLLSFVRTEDKKEPESLDLQHTVEDTLSLIRTIMRHDQISIEVEVPDNLPEIRGYNQQIQQVLINLLTNARDALNEKYPGFNRDKLIRIKAENIDRDGRTWLRTTVEDHGPGISEKVRNRMFEPFLTTKPAGMGTGLGLSIISDIVKNHGGKIEVETEVGRYTCFHIDLPLI